MLAIIGISRMRLSIHTIIVCTLVWMAALWMTIHTISILRMVGACELRIAMLSVRKRPIVILRIAWRCKLGLVLLVLVNIGVYRRARVLRPILVRTILI